jgi:hypothetical protein
MPPAEETELQARVLAAARAEAEARGWPWLEPVEVTLTRAAPGARHWQVRTNTAARGRSARIVIAEPDFEVVESGYLPR